MTLDLFEGRTDIWRGGLTPPKNTQTTSTGFPLLDKKLACGGWPKGSVIEILCGDDGTPPLWLVMPALAKLSCQSAWITWVAPPFVPYAPALQAMGVELSKIMLVHTRNLSSNAKTRIGENNKDNNKTNKSDLSDQCWALEQALKSGTASAVLGWLHNDNPKVLRRLQLAAEAGSTTGFIFRPQRYAQQQSNAAIRLSVDLHPRGLSIKILKCRGGWSNTDEPVRVLFDQLPTCPINTLVDVSPDASPDVSLDTSPADTYSKTDGQKHSHSVDTNKVSDDVSQIKDSDVFNDADKRYGNKKDASEHIDTVIRNYTNPQPYIAKAQRSLFSQPSSPSASLFSRASNATAESNTSKDNMNERKDTAATELRKKIEKRYASTNKQASNYQTIDGKTIIKTAHKQVNNTTGKEQKSEVTANGEINFPGDVANGGNTIEQTQKQSKKLSKRSKQPAPLSNGLDSILDLFANHQSSTQQTRYSQKDPEQ